MTTLISVYNSGGCVGRCDARCHNALSDTCDCVCGGMNHGVGLRRAVSNTQEYAEDMVRKYASEKNLDRNNIHTNVPARQIELPV